MGFGPPCRPAARRSHRLRPRPASLPPRCPPPRARTSRPGRARAATRRSGAERGADPRLALPHRDHQRDQTEETDGGERSGQRAEPREHPHRETPGGRLARHHVPQGATSPTTTPGSSSRATCRTSDTICGAGPAVRTSDSDANGGLPGRQVHVQPGDRYPSIPHVVDHADDRLPAWLLEAARRALRRHQHQLPHRASSRPEASGHGSADDDDIGFRLHIRRREVAARQQARADRIEVARRDRFEIRPWVLAPGRVGAKACLLLHDRQRVVADGAAQRS